MGASEPWVLVAMLSWAVYLGGALAMELIWRPAQATIPPGQINVLCQRMGARYRWVALGSLLGAGAATLAAERSRLGAIDLSTGYGRTAVVLVACWVLLAVGLTAITFLVHPALHVRDPASMSPGERAAARERVRVAIRRMDRLLRADIAVALMAVLLVAALPESTVG